MAALVRAATVDDAPGIAAVHVAAWAETYAGIVPAEALARPDEAERTVRWRAIVAGEGDPRHRPAVAVALDAEGRVAGFAAFGEMRDDALAAAGLTGEVSALYLLRRVQGRGLGRALMGWAAGALLARGHTAMGLWALRDNRPARRFYEALGGVMGREKDDELGGAPVVEVAYGWASLDALSAALDSSTASAASANKGVGSSQ